MGREEGVDGEQIVFDHAYLAVDMYMAFPPYDLSCASLEHASSLVLDLSDDNLPIRKYTILYLLRYVLTISSFRSSFNVNTLRPRIRVIRG